MLRLHDESGLVSDFSFEPKTAHEIGATLVAGLSAPEMHARQRGNKDAFLKSATKRPSN
jgi:hypothetical protein